MKSTKLVSPMNRFWRELRAKPVVSEPEQPVQPMRLPLELLYECLPTPVELTTEMIGPLRLVSWHLLRYVHVHYGRAAESSKIVAEFCTRTVQRPLKVPYAEKPNSKAWREAIRNVQGLVTLKYAVQLLELEVEGYAGNTLDALLATAGDISWLSISHKKGDAEAKGGVAVPWRWRSRLVAPNLTVLELEALKCPSRSWGNKAKPIDLPDLSGLTSLQYLSFAWEYGGFAYPAPTGIIHLPPSLRHLRIKGELRREPLRLRLEECPALESLNIKDDLLAGIYQPGSLQNLRKLILHNGSPEDFFASIDFSQLRSLEELLLHGHSWQSFAGARLPTTLSRLDLYFCHFSSLHGLDMMSLRTLSLRACTVSDWRGSLSLLSTALRENPKLEALDLSVCAFGPEDLADFKLSSSTGLRFINLSNCRVERGAWAQCVDQLAHNSSLTDIVLPAQLHDLFTVLLLTLSRRGREERRRVWCANGFVPTYANVWSTTPRSFWMETCARGAAAIRPDWDTEAQWWRREEEREGGWPWSVA